MRAEWLAEKFCLLPDIRTSLARKDEIPREKKPVMGIMQKKVEKWRCIVAYWTKFSCEWKSRDPIFSFHDSNINLIFGAVQLIKSRIHSWWPISSAAWEHVAGLQLLGSLRSVYMMSVGWWQLLRESLAFQEFRGTYSSENIESWKITTCNYVRFIEDRGQNRHVIVRLSLIHINTPLLVGPTLGI